MMSKEQFEQLMSKLDALIKITAVNASRGKSIAEIALLLSDLGFKNVEIASILGTTPAYIGKVKYEAGKEQKGKSAGKKKQKIESQTIGAEQEAVETDDKQRSV